MSKYTCHFLVKNIVMTGLGKILSFFVALCDGTTKRVLIFYSIGKQRKSMELTVDLMILFVSELFGTFFDFRGSRT